MAYVNPNFRSAAALRRALAAGEPVEVYQPGLGTVPKNGSVLLEGPHYPEPHTWYVGGVMENGKLVKIKK